MDALKRSAAATLLMLAVLGTGFALDEVRNPDVYTVTDLLMELPTGEDVTVRGEVVTVQEEYTAESGNAFQRFYITDGDAEVLVFCDTRRGRIPVTEGDRVTVHARFTRFDRTYELSTVCGDAITIH